MLIWEETFEEYKATLVRVRPQHSFSRVMVAWFIGCAAGFVFDVATGLIRL